MLKLRLLMVLLVFWLAGLYNIERIHEPINLASFVYVLVGLSVAAVIATPRIGTSKVAQITLATLPVYVLLKWSLGYEFFGANLPITVTECVVLGVTNLLAGLVAHGIDEFVRTAGEVAAMQLPRHPLSFEDGESEMYTEVQRARRFQRSLSLATVSFGRSFKGAQLERLMQKVRHEMIRKHVESRVAGVLLEATSACDLVISRNGGFLVLFPETDAESARSLLQAAACSLHEQLGLRLQIGVAQFPNEEYTLAGLINRAESEMSWVYGDASEKEGAATIDGQANVEALMQAAVAKKGN